MSSSLACTYAALLLHDSKKPVTASDILAVTSAAKITVPKFHAETFAKYYDQDSLSKLITALSTPGAGVSSGPSVESKKEEAPKKVEAKKEEPKKVEEKKESDDGPVMGLFGDDE